MLKIVDISSHQSPNFSNVGENGSTIAEKFKNS